MGTDIHAVFQKKSGDKWEDIPSRYEGNRHYVLFAHLAGVRNGTGFAGVVTGQAVKPISEPRGLPSDFLIMDDDRHPISAEAASKWELSFLGDGEPLVRWMGDHSHSWLTADEILSHIYGGEWTAGIVSIDQFAVWDGVSSPRSYSGGIWGGGIEIADNPCAITEQTTHVRVFWREPSAHFDYFTDEVKRLKKEHCEVRMVFGFDN